jgi:hypothetical protein
MSSKGFWTALLTLGVLTGSLGALPAAQAHRWNDYRYRNYHHSRAGLVDYQTGKILKGGLIGAGIGAGTGLLLEGNVGRNALIGAGLGAGTQAIRYSRTMRRHPIMKTAGYGALTGVGVSALTRHGNLGTGALIGGALGTGLGAFQNRY